MQIDNMIDSIRNDYGNSVIMRGSFINSSVKWMCGGSGNEEHYPQMKSYL